MDGTLLKTELDYFSITGKREKNICGLIGQKKPKVLRISL